MKENVWKTKESKKLIEALLSLRSSDEAERFLRDLMTEKEIREFSNRFEAASQLSRSVQYNSIIEDTGLSSTTIARISKWLKGQGGGYRLVLNRIKNNKAHHDSSKLGKGLSLSI